MTRFFFILLWGILFFMSCTNGANESLGLQAKIDSLSQIVSNQNITIKQMRDTISLLQFPADQRLQLIKKLIAEENYSEARSAIYKLQSIFPNSVEATQSIALNKQIDSKLAAIEAERQRIKALGFKALKTQTKATIEYNTVTFGSFNIGAKFTHDVYPTYSGSSWYEHTADRDNKYISCAMDVTSTSKEPDIPTLAFYSVDGDKLILKGTFWIQMARWKDYGAYLGNENDLKNDFSKVSTVKFKLGLELPQSLFSKPYVIVLRKVNTQVRHYNRFDNPPISYSGVGGYPNTLTIDDFSNGLYVAVKVANL